MRSIRTKVNGVIIFSILAVVIVMGVLYSISQFAHLRASEDKFIGDSVRSAATIAFTISSHFVANDFTNMNDMVSHFRKRSYREYVVVMDNNRRILAHSDAKKIGGIFTIPDAYKTEMIGKAAIRRYIRAGDEFIDITYPINAGDLTLGEIHLGLNDGWIRNEQARILRTIFIFSGVAAAVALIGMMVASSIAERITRPLLLLGQAAENVGRGDYPEAVSVRSDDEVGVLAAAFNRMIADLGDSRAQLVEKKYLDSIITNINDALFVTDSQGSITMINRVTKDLLGYGEDELLKRPLSTILAGGDFSSGVIEEMAMKGFAGNAEMLLLAKDLRKIPVLLSVASLRRQDEVCETVCVAKDITERKQAEEQIRAALTEKEILLKEVHHRVKNNLQVVASMLQLQSAHIKDHEARLLFEESQKRVESMSLIHEKLYRSKDLAEIDFREYVGELVENLLSLNTGNAERLDTKVDIEGVFLDINNAIPCGLIINELVSNSLRHAFPDGRKGEILISMLNNDGQLTLVVADDGIGFPGHIDFRNTSSLGMQLVISLVQQLCGSMELKRDKGTFFRISFSA